MQAHEGESILSYLLSVPALGKTKPPSGGSQAVFSTLATNKQTIFGHQVYICVGRYLKEETIINLEHIR